VHLGIKAKQIGGVTLIVGLAVVGLSLLYVTFVAGTLITAASESGGFVADTVFERAKHVVSGAADPWAAIAADKGLSAIFTASYGQPNITYVTICNAGSLVVVSSIPNLEDRPPPATAELSTLTELPRLRQLMALYLEDARTYDIQRRLKLNDMEFGSIRIGISTTLIREQMRRVLGTVAVASLLAMLVAVLLAAGFARVILRPIHVIRGGLSRLGRGEFDVRLNLSQQDEFGELGSFFDAVSAQRVTITPDLSFYRPNLLTNINTPATLRAAEAA